ncbi:MAG TPA: Nramp family divalent metal transporter [Vicinamibacteria bacterium]|nr:Nramp family divalent metal transporter [Vicinamibacteria bacterium]
MPRDLTEMPREARSGLEPWGRAELPAPPDTRGLRLLSVVGPGAIVLGATIGSGEWLVGPAAFVKYGLSLLWVTALAVTFQAVFNTEVVRYTLYTGEPAFTGFMRTRPGARFWAWAYAGLYFLQNGWPGWAGASAGAIFFLAAGRPATSADSGALHLVGVGAYLLCVLILVLGGRRIERTLEVLNWALVTGILLALTALCLRFAPPERWLAAAAGFFAFDSDAGAFRFLPEGADWFLIGAFAAYSGCGGVTNITLSNWSRDKGYGMGQVVGYIPTLVSGKRVNLAHTGSVFEPDAASLARWRGWWRIVRADQWGIFFPGALLGMALPAILYTTAIPVGTEVRGLAIASELARALAERGGPTLPLLLALISVWILFKAQLDILEATVRSLTDILWSASSRLRAWRGGDVRAVYFSVLACLVAWGIFALGLTQPIVLLQLAANVAGFVMTLAPLHVLRVNTTLLPEPLRPSRARQAVLVGMALFYGSFVWLWLMGGLVPDPEKGFLLGLLRRLDS